MSDDDVTFNVTGLEKLLKSLKVSKMPTARVGILGAKAGPHQPKSGTKSKDTPTNAMIGAVHEFGSPARGIPQRSFLRVPIADYLQKRMESSGAFDFDTVNEVLKQGSVTPWLKKVAVVAESIVLEAFDTGGFGKWPTWAKGYSNNTGQLLVDTTQLRNSITSEVKE